MDTRFLSTSGPPTFYSYGDGSIDRVRANFHDTAKLIAVVNDITPGFALAGRSDFDYQAIVVTEVSPNPAWWPCLPWDASCWGPSGSDALQPCVNDASV